MQIQIFAIPVDGDPAAVDDLNRFLRSNRVLGVQKTAIVAEGRSFWSICIDYLPTKGAASAATTESSGSAKPRIDYRDLLGPVEFERYSKMRELRKRIAEQDGVPVYSLFTNAQLADMAREVPADRAALAKIDGIGDARIERYGDRMLELLATLPPKEAAPAEAQPVAAAEPASDGLLPMKSS